MPLVLLDGHELADRLGVHYGTVLTLARNGRIPSIKGPRGKVLFNLDKVLDGLRPPKNRLRDGEPAGEEVCS
jgi:excisionase family DNA binding protein